MLRRSFVPVTLLALIGAQFACSGAQSGALSEEELMDLCRKRLDEYAVPWEIEFREALPKSFVGKVLRRMLVEE